MKNYKKLNLLLVILCTTCIQAKSDNPESEFVPYTTNKYKYTKMVYLWKEEPQTLPAKILSYVLETHKAEPSVLEKISQYLNVHTTASPAANKIITPIVVSDITTSHTFDNGITRKKITQELNNDIIITITETWETQNPSYLIPTNIILALSTFAAVSLGAGCVFFRIVRPALDPKHPYNKTLVKWVIREDNQNK